MLIYYPIGSCSSEGLGLKSELSSGITCPTSGKIIKFPDGSKCKKFSLTYFKKLKEFPEMKD